MPPPATISILFATEAAANYLVAGIPAAARAVMHAASMQDVGGLPGETCVAVPGGWTPSPLCAAEIGRLAPSVRWSAESLEVETVRSWISGEGLQCGTAGAQLEFASDRPLTNAANVPELQRQARRIIASTGKPGDGIVSRHINRPISQAMSRIVLHWPGARAWHATFAAAIIGMVMFAVLLFGGYPGLLIGAALFQFASIVDGVDGEIARATFRTSARGAMMDSVTDAATNLGFVGGVSYNLYTGGAEHAGLAGALGFGFLALGSAILALQSRRDGGPFTFDALKSQFRQRPSRLKQALIYLTMRDFYAFAAFVAILAGAASQVLFAFAAVTIGWFAVLCWMLVGAASRRDGR
jgi:phosphatidylglycerophosphate synthase